MGALRRSAQLSAAARRDAAPRPGKLSVIMRVGARAATSYGAEMTCSAAAGPRLPRTDGGTMAGTEQAVLISAGSNPDCLRREAAPTEELRTHQRDSSEGLSAEVPVQDPGDRCAEGEVPGYRHALASVCQRHSEQIAEWVKIMDEVGMEKSII